MFYDDLKYMQLLSMQLGHCVQRDQYLWNFRCPICGDSERDKFKARGYVYRSGEQLFYKCHNCGLSTSFGHLLSVVAPELYSAYSLNRFRSDNTSSGIISLMESSKVQTDELLHDSILDGMQRVDELPLDHPAVTYLSSRKIPAQHWKSVYVVKDFNSWLLDHSLNKYILHSCGEHPRLILPVIDQHSRVGSFGARAFPGTEAEHIKRYTSVTLNPDVPRVFGLDRVKVDRPILVVEGQLDSLFLNNAVAVEGSTLDVSWVRGIKPLVTLIADNEPRNIQITRQIHRYIREGYRVAMFPKWIQGKDINEMILHGMSQDDLNKIIASNSFQGLEAEVRFSEWKSINT